MTENYLPRRSESRLNALLASDSGKSSVSASIGVGFSDVILTPVASSVILEFEKCSKVYEN